MKNVSLGITPLLEISRYNCRVERKVLREIIAEFFGTFFLVIFIVGASFQYGVMKLEDENFNEPILSYVLGISFGIMGIVFIFFSSSAHLNPAFSLGLAISGHCSWFKVPIFALSQFLGAYFGSCCVYFMFRHMLPEGINTDSQIAEFFSPVPPEVPSSVGLVAQILETSLVQMGILSCIDSRNGIPKYLFPLYWAFLIAGVILSIGLRFGATLNPARDFAPRILFINLGYDPKAILQNSYKGDIQEWWMVGLFGPLIGGALGSILYIYIIGAQLDGETEDEKFEESELGEEKEEDEEIVDWTAWRSKLYQRPQTGVKSLGKIVPTLPQIPPAKILTKALSEDSKEKY